jgi:Ser/Thr protein kinase RdoA (MazF antagonist)
MIRVATAVPPARTPDFERQLEEHLKRAFGRRRPIHRLVRRFCPYTSSFQIDELDVHFSDRSSLKLVVKDLSFGGMLETARAVRPEFLYEPRREIDAYRCILPHAPAGTAATYGAVVEPAADRYCLFLEHVDGLQLSQVGSFAAWKQAAAWIGRFHSAFPAGRAEHLVRRSNLLVYDERFFWQWIHRARQFASGRSSRRQIERIASRYGAVVKRLASLPRSIIHGELFACNVLVTTGRQGVRICPVDWEMAAYGPSLIDLASLSAGWADGKQRALARAYRAAVVGSSGARTTKSFEYDLDCCRLYLAMRMLGWSANWRPPTQHARDWLGEATKIADRLRALT